MAYRVEIARNAEAELEQLYLWVTERAPQQGARWFNGLERAVLSLSDHPNRCPIAPESVDPHSPVRVLHYGRKPHVYRVFFTIDDEASGVNVVHVRRGARQAATAEDLKGKRAMRTHRIATKRARLRADVQAGFDQLRRGEDRSYDRTSSRRLTERGQVEWAGRSHQEDLTSGHGHFADVFAFTVCPSIHARCRSGLGLTVLDRVLEYSRMSSLNDRVAVVTGGTCGVGRGVARALAREGARVYITGRSVSGRALEDGIVGIRCDHREETDVVTAFARVTQETQGIDILVNNVWGGYERIVDNGRVHLGHTVLRTAGLAM